MSEEINKVPQALLDKLKEGREILEKIPGVIWVSYGRKKSNNILSDDYCFLVCVDEKKEQNELTESNIVPRSLFGFKTDVIDNPELENLSLDSADYYRRAHNPLIGGIMISNGLANPENGSRNVGTLGVIAKKDNANVILTAKHVLYANGGVDGSQIGHPSVTQGCSDCCDAGVIGHILDKTDDALDCATASILASSSSENTLREIGDHLGAGPASVGVTVRKIGIRTGLTSGIIIALPPSEPDNFQVEAIDGFTLDGLEVFAGPGDSGAAIIDSNDKIIGLVIARYVIYPHIVKAVKIERAITELGIIIEPSDTGLEFLKAPKVEETVAKTAFNKLVEHYPSLGHINELFSAHKSEILDLVNNEREVKVGWHRKRGPVYFAHFLKAAKESKHTIPAEVDGVSFSSLLMHLTAMFDKYGSKDLKEDLKDSALEVMQSLIALQKESQINTNPNNE